MIFEVGGKWSSPGRAQKLTLGPGNEVASLLGPVSQKTRKLYGPEKPVVKLRPAYSVKLVFSYVVKGIRIKITAKFRALRRLRFEDTKRIMSPEIRPKSFGTFEKQAPVHDFLARKVGDKAPRVGGRVASSVDFSNNDRSNATLS